MKQRRLPWQKVDWAKYCANPKLLLCSWAAQGVWPRVTALCWYAEPRGRFLLDGKPPAMADLAVLWSKPIDSFPPLLAELQSRGLLVADRDGFYIPDMVADELARRTGQAPGEPERAVVDRAMEAALVVLSADDKRKASGRARSARYRSKVKGQKALEQMRALAAMEVAQAISEGVTGVTDASRGASPEGVTVTSPGGPVTLPKPCATRGLRVISTEEESDSDSEVLDGEMSRRAAS